MDSREEEDIAWLNSTFHPIPKPALPDDCIEYSLYIIDSALGENNELELRPKLRDVQKYATELQKQWLKDYIWQRQSFSLELIKGHGLSFLQGRTEFGDSIEDEWVVVWLLRELSKKFPTLWVKLTDSDGEFLLIEASGTLPSWLEPEVADNRVWINQGQLKILKPAGKGRSSQRTDEKLKLEEAYRIILTEPRRILHSTMMEEEAFYRLRNYPAQINANMHHAIVKLPRKVAYLLLKKPAYIAPAIEAFYLRDPISLKPLQAQGAASRLNFTPNDLVELSVRFPRVGYAQVRSQDFPILEVWKSRMPAPGDADARSQTETGMKVACGFEMLLSDPHHQDRPAVREMNLLLEDLESGDASLPTDDELRKLEKRVDDEKWMDISFDDLQAELNRKGADAEGGVKKSAEFGDKAAQENLQRIVKQFESFLNDDQAGNESGLFDGDSDLDDLDDIDSDELEEDMDASFNEDEFTQLMQQMMGMPPEVMEELRKGTIDALTNGAEPPNPIIPGPSRSGDRDIQDVSSDDDDEELQELMKRIGAELEASGALDLHAEPAVSTKKAVSGDKSGRVVEELSSDEDLLDERMNEQLARNLVESFRSQGGRPGPASNLMAMMAERQTYTGNGVEENKSRSTIDSANGGKGLELIEDVD